MLVLITRVVNLSQVLQNEEAAEEQRNMVLKEAAKDQEAVHEVEQRERDFKVELEGLLANVVGELLAARRELEETAGAVTTKDLAMAALEARAKEVEEQHELEQRAAEAHKAEVAHSTEALRDELAKQRTRCQTFEEEAERQKQQARAVPQSWCLTILKLTCGELKRRVGRAEGAVHGF